MLGEALRLIRVFHDYKISQLAEGIQLSPSYISELESGKKTPSMDVLQKYAGFFDTKVSGIVFFAESLDSEKGGAVGRNVKKRLLGFLKYIERTTI